MPHSIFPSDGYGANPSAGICSYEFDADQTNKHDVNIPIPGTSADKLPTDLKQRVPMLSLPNEFTLGKMSLVELTEHCLSEINLYQSGKLLSDTYCMELFRRTISQRDQDAWKTAQHCLSETVCGWLEHHPKREMAYRLDSKEIYVARAFERFYQAVTHQQVEFSTLAAALRYLQASLNGAILETLRSSSRSPEVPLTEQDSSDKSVAADSRNNDIWNMLRNVLTNGREQRLAYLLFNYGLKPKDIVNICPQEFSDVREISRLRCVIIERLLNHVDKLG